MLLFLGLIAAILVTSLVFSDSHDQQTVGAETGVQIGVRKASAKTVVLPRKTSKLVTRSSSTGTVSRISKIYPNSMSQLFCMRRTSEDDIELDCILWERYSSADHTISTTFFNFFLC